jgi:hypothetical protein
MPAELTYSMQPVIVPPPAGRAPLVSVVMPTYNGECFLGPAIESILNQTFRDFDLVAKVASLDVKLCDYFNTGRMPPQGLGSALVKYQWQMVNGGNRTNG